MICISSFEQCRILRNCNVRLQINMQERTDFKSDRHRMRMSVEDLGMRRDGVPPFMALRLWAHGDAVWVRMRAKEEKCPLVGVDLFGALLWPLDGVTMISPLESVPYQILSLLRCQFSTTAHFLRHYNNCGSMHATEAHVWLRHKYMSSKSRRHFSP